MYDRALHLPSSHSPWPSRAWGRISPCARHLWGRHLKLSYFFVPPPEGISTNFSVLARPSTSCRLRWEQQQSRSTVVSCCGAGALPLTVLSHGETWCLRVAALIPSDTCMLLAQMQKITLPSSSGSRYPFLTALQRSHVQCSIPLVPHETGQQIWYTWTRQEEQGKNELQREDSSENTDYKWKGAVSGLEAGKR